MSSTCDKCFENPCTCGKQYDTLTTGHIVRIVEALRNVLNSRNSGIKVIVEDSRDEEQKHDDDKVRYSLKEQLKHISLPEDMLKVISFYNIKTLDQLFITLRNNPIKTLFKEQSIWIFIFMLIFTKLEDRRAVLNDALVKILTDNNYFNAKAVLIQYDTYYKSFPHKVYEIANIFPDNDLCTDEQYMHKAMWNVLHTILFQMMSNDSDYNILSIYTLLKEFYHILTHWTKSDVIENEKSLTETHQFSKNAPYFYIDILDMQMSNTLLDQLPSYFDQIDVDLIPEQEE